MGNSDRRKFFDSFLRMNPITWLTLTIAVLSFSTPALTSEPRVVCYYTNWSVYRPGTARFNPQNINPYLCTHLIYAFGGFTKENTLKPFDKYQDIEKGGYAKFTGLKTYNKNLKTLLAIGGWNEGSARFSPMVASKEHRREFVRNAIKFLRQNHFDGLDLDWEYPAFRDGGKPKDRENYAKLVKELREEFERESEKTGKPRLLLTMAVPAGIEYIQKGFDVKTLNQYLDWMNLLTYDYHSAFEPAVNHHAPLYPLEEPNEYSVDDELNIDYTIKFYLENGADRDKLVLGIPTYGRSYNLFNPDATELGSPADGPGDQGDATREKGYLAYYEICEALKPKVKKPPSSDEDEDDSSEEDQPWTLVQPNPKAMGPYAYRGNQWVGYDDVDIVKKKAEYVAENGLGGIMFWSIDNDDFRGNCHGKPYPLIEAAKEAYIVGLGSDNAIAERPSSTTSRSNTRRRNRPRTSTTTTAKPAAVKSNKRKQSSTVTSTTPSWNIVTPEPPTTPDPGTDFKCTDEGFFPHPRDCKKYFWCLDSGPSNLGIVAHHFTCPSGLFFNKAADSCDFARNVHCKKPAATTKAPATAVPTTAATTTTTTRKPIKLTTKSSLQFRTKATTTTTPEPEVEEEYEDSPEDEADIDAEDPKVLKELIDLIKKVGGVEQLEKQLHLSEAPVSTDGAITTTASPFNKKLYQKVLERTRGKSKLSNTLEILTQNSRRGPQNAGLEATADKDVLLKKDRPQYTTIQRSRPLTQTPEDPQNDEDSTPQTFNRARAVVDDVRGTTTKPLQYVNIRRARPSDAADDTASRNALFERPESIVSLSETPNSLDIASARRENIPEYVTIRRQRPTTEEATTIAYQPTEDSEVETQETALEREISSPVQPQYTSIVRSRPTTSAPAEIITPEPTTVLAVQISSLLNSPPEEELLPEVETTIAEAEPETTTTTSTTTPPPPSSPPRRVVQRRRGSTTTTTQQPTTQGPKRPTFLRRTRLPASTSSPQNTTDSEPVVTTESSLKSTRRGPNKFKSRQKQANDTVKQIEEEKAGNRKSPSLNGSGASSERPTRNFVRRRLGGANATTSAAPLSSSSQATRRPFRVASRRRPAASSSTTTTTIKTSTSTEASTIASEEYLQDVDENEAVEDSTVPERRGPKTPKIQRRPFVLKDDEDQNPAATNEDKKRKEKNSGEDGKRHSKKYSSSFKQNQLDEVLRKATSQEDYDLTTDGKLTTVEDYSAETALAIAAHQLLSAPPPIVPNYDEEDKPKRKSGQTTYEYKFTSPAYTEPYTSTRIYDDSTKETSTAQIGSFDSAKTTFTPKITSTTFSRASKPFSTPILSTLNPTTSFSELKDSDYSSRAQISSTLRSFPRSRPTAPGFSIETSPRISPVSLGSSTARHLSPSEKLIPIPVEDYSLSPAYSSIGQEPSYFTREYLLESPVTKTYDEEYQYLSVTPQTTTKKIPRKTVVRKISTTMAPTPAPYVPLVTSPKPRRVPARKPFEKIAKPARTFRPIENYDYYDEGDEKMGNKYEEGTKVILHSKGIIECLDIGNFPSPNSCKKFISCARLENGSLLGWEYICPKGLSFDPVGGICNWSAGLGCDDKDI